MNLFNWPLNLWIKPFNELDLGPLKSNFFYFLAQRIFPILPESPHCPTIGQFDIYCPTKYSKSWFSCAFKITLLTILCNKMCKKYPKVWMTTSQDFVQNLHSFAQSHNCMMATFRIFVSNHWTVGHTLSNDQTVGHTLFHHQTVEHSLSNDQTVE